MQQESERLAVIEVALVSAMRQRSVEPISHAFCDVLRFSPIDKRIDRSNWSATISDLLTEDPHLFAIADEVVIVGLCLAQEESSLDSERIILTQVLLSVEEAVFVVTDRSRRSFRLIYAEPVPALTAASHRRVFRRMEIAPGGALRFIAKRISGLAYRPITDALRQVFAVETVTEEFLQMWKSLWSRIAADFTEQTGDASWSHAFALDALDRCLASAMLHSARYSPFSPDTSLRSLVRDALARNPDLGSLYAVTSPQRFVAEVCSVLAYFPVTIHEDTPLDRTLAITPAIVGSAYEYLGMLDGGDKRMEMGVFYTPPTEVDLMCRLALVSYLVNVLGETHRGALYDLVFALLPPGEANAEEVLRHLPSDVRDGLRTVLSTLTVLDPACGSGAFLIGMLRVLAQLMQRVDRAIDQPPVVSSAQRIAAIIRNTLYGIDVQTQALTRAALRLRLAWQAACTSGETSQDAPLAHLTHGDAFFCPLTLRIKIWQGFDIVIGNPPYVRQERIVDPLQTREQAGRPEVRRAYKRAIAEQIARLFPFFFSGTVKRTIDGKSDLSLYFFFRGLSWLNDRGILCYVTSSAWLDAQYGAVLQEFLLRHCSIEMILDTRVKRSFPAAVDTSITLARAPQTNKSTEDWEQLAHFVMLSIPYEQAAEASLFEEITRSQYPTLTERYRVYPISHRELLLDGMQSKQVLEERDED